MSTFNIVSKQFLLLFFVLYSFAVNAQSDSLKMDSLKKVLLTEKEDTNRVNTLINIGEIYNSKGIVGSSLQYYFDALKVSEATGNKESLYKSFYTIAGFYTNGFNNNLALEYALKARQIAEELHDKDKLYKIYNLIGGFIYFNDGKYNQAFEYGHKMMKIVNETNDSEKIRYMQAWFGDLYRLAKKPDSSVIMYKMALQTSKALKNKQAVADCLHGIGLAYASTGNNAEAINYYRQLMEFCKKKNVFTGFYLSNIAEANLEIHRYDSALFYAKSAQSIYKSFNSGWLLMNGYELLSKIYAADSNYQQAYFNHLHFVEVKDSVQSAEVQNKLTLIQSNYKTEKQNKEIDFLEKEARLQETLRNVMIIASILLIVIGFLVFNKYRQKRKSEIILNSKNTELTQTLADLKSTQAQLIQSEKMASLGELTAGIAHEIQNPLNFVNNFSDVNNELLIELKDEIKKGNTNEANAIADDLIANEEKINHHGKRADAIVKGMLQHSRKSSGVKEPTDINALCDEYLRLSYHGLRTKDKDFNAAIKTDFDETIGKINIIPQDIGRVLLNLYNNAFYALAEKKKMQEENYEPTISVSTKKFGNKIEIKVKDNGNGIPQNIVDKIYQPFFTTKPTGQGTGLGLSLSYDIVKAHGGEIKLETKEDEGSEFIIQLSVTTNDLL